ncbi:MAG: hypothetical protein RSD88_08245 [Anaerovoracaceae bacterium]
MKRSVVVNRMLTIAMALSVALIPVLVFAESGGSSRSPWAGWILAGIMCVCVIIFSIRQKFKIKENDKKHYK